jgi:hypothetical protein
MISLHKWLPTLVEAFTLYGGGGKGGSKSSAQPTQQTVTQTNIPEYARPYVERLLGKSEAITDLSQNPYRVYEGNRFAGFSPMQQQAFDRVQNQQVAEQIGAGSTMAGMAGIGSLGAGQNYTSQVTNPNAVASYMSPYMQNVVDAQKFNATRDFNKQLQVDRARSVGQNAFGGSRQAIQEAEATRSLQDQLGQIQARGLQDAFSDAQKNIQFGSSLGLQGYGQAGSLAGTLGQLGQEQFGQQQAITQGIGTAGAQQQALAQQGLDAQFQEFQNQQNYPYKQLAFMSDMLRGLPLSQTAQTQYAPAPSGASQVAGLGLAGLGLYNATK